MVSRCGPVNHAIHVAVCGETFIVQSSNSSGQQLMAEKPIAAENSNIEFQVGASNPNTFRNTA